jgi:hypothetical protein
VKDKIRALARRTSQQPPGATLIRLNQIMRGWANYFKHAVCKHTLESLENFAWAPGDALVNAPASLEVAWTSAGTSPVITAGGAGRPRTGSSCSTPRR